MQDPTVAAAEQLAWQMKSLKSIEMNTSEIFKRNDFGGDGPSTFVQSSHRYLETAGGSRLFEERNVTKEGKETLDVSYKNGDRAAKFEAVDLGNSRIDTVRIQKSFPRELESGWYNCPQPLQVFYCGLEPLADALKRARYLGDKTRLGRPCHEFYVPRSTSDDPCILVYSLDVETSVPLSVAVFTNDVDYVAGKAASLWNARSIDQVDGMFYAANSDYTIYSLQDWKPQLVQQIKVDSLILNKDYDSSIFWPKITAETQVIDTISGKIVHSPAAKSLVAPVRSTTAATSPIRVSAWDGAGWVLPTAIIAMGVLILAAVWWNKIRAKASVGVNRTKPSPG